MKIKIKPCYVYAVLAAAVALALILGADTAMWLLVAALFLYAARPRSLMHRIKVKHSFWVKRLFTILIALLTVAVCILPMNLFPIWNGEIPGHRNQYELITEAFLEGRLDFAYGDEDALAQLENPYDPEARKEAGVRYHWDHAYYNGKYYMYFGVVPVFLAFLPYRVLTGTALPTMQATQAFAALAVLGIFALFHLLSKLFFKRMPYSVYIALSVAFSVMSVWYASAEPALYCTAITAAMMLEIWSLYFFIRAVWGDGSENVKILLAAIGALLGALVFGCRPPIALANILVIPMLYVFIRQRKFTWKLLGKLCLAALPYAFVAAGLMLYNYARFENPFEFGQAYQLTVADQTSYKLTLDTQMLLKIFNNTAENFFGLAGIRGNFPYLYHGGVFFNFPILFLTAAVFKTSVRRELKKQNLRPFVIGLAVAMVLISALDIMWTPYLLERYRMDIYFLAGIACFITIGLWIKNSSLQTRGRIATMVVALSVVTVVSCFFYFMRTTNVYYPEWVEEIGNLFAGK